MIKAVDLRRDYMDNGAFREVVNRIEDKLVTACRLHNTRQCVVRISEMDIYDKDIYHDLVDAGYRVIIREDDWVVEW